MAVGDSGNMTMVELLALRHKLSSALAQVDAMVAARPTVREPVDRIGNFAIDGEARRVLVDGEELRLPRIEYELLGCLVGNVGRLVTFEELTAHIWTEATVPVNPNRALKVHIRWLRERLAGRGPLKIVNVRGAGYRLDLLDEGAGRGKVLPAS